MAEVKKLKEINSQLWQRVHTLELQANLLISKKKREQKQFKKQLVRISKYLDLSGKTPLQVAESLDVGSNDCSESSSESDFVEFEPQLAKKKFKKLDPEATESENEQKSEAVPKTSHVR